MTIRTVIVILVASLVSSQGVFIYSSIEDLFEDPQFPSFSYGTVPLVPYSQDYVAATPAAPHPTVPSASQSDMNIKPAIDVPAPEMAALTFTNYDIKFPQTISFTATDDDLIFVIRYQANEQNDAFPSFTYGRLNDTFILEELHFHFAHGESYMVHYNSKYGNFDEATKHRDGVAVLAILTEIPSKQDNIPFRLAEKIFHPESINVTLPGKPIVLEELRIPNEADFCRYFESLTTPDFNEVDSWTAFDEHIALYLNGKFRGLFDEEGRPIEDNFRPVQSS